MHIDYQKLLKDRRPDEKVIMVVRHHWFILLRDTAGIIILFFVPFFIVPFILQAFGQGGSLLAVPAGMTAFFATLWTLIVWHLLFLKWTDYYFDLWIITNLRIVDIDQRGLFNRDVTTLLDLDHIQDINTQTVGIIANLLNFGTLMLQTAGAKVEFVMDDVAHPQKVEQAIRNTQLEHSHGALHAHASQPSL